MANPKLLLAFSYDPVQALPALVEELNALQSIFSSALVEPIPVWLATQAKIEEYFLRYRAEIRLFHFSGHAGENVLQLNGLETGPRIVFAEGLAGFMGVAPALRLVFLNGCSTEEQAKFFLRHGASAVIATTVPLEDRYGVDFARRFYQNFTAQPNSGAGLCLEEAFQVAWQSFVAFHGRPGPAMLHEQLRSIYPLDTTPIAKPLYRLWLNENKPEAARERFGDWLKPDTDTRKELIRKHIAQGKLEQALAVLVEIVPDSGMQLQGQYQAASQQYFMSLMNNRDWLQIQAQISYSVLQLLRKEP